MPSDTRATLRQVILNQGRVLATDPRRCEAMLKDLCPDQRREVNLLVNALREQVAADLLSAQAGEPVAMRLARLSRRLEDQLSIKPEAAAWAVESWALALGVMDAPAPVRSPAPTHAPRAAAKPAPAKAHQEATNGSALIDGGWNRQRELAENGLRRLRTLIHAMEPYSECSGASGYLSEAEQRLDASDYLTLQQYEIGARELYQALIEGSRDHLAVEIARNDEEIARIAATEKKLKKIKGP